MTALLAFWIFFALTIYSYLVYPIVLWILALLFGRTSRTDDAYTPSVSLIIPAYNEESIIATKIENSLALTYPPEKLEILVASESDDGTDEIVRLFERWGVKLLPSRVRRGKVANIHRAVPVSQGEILVLTDANAMLNQDALRRMVRHFADSRIASVSGRLVYQNPKGSAAGESEGLYWSMEQIIKRASSRLFSLPGANGSLFAVRRACYRPITENRGDDFEIPIRCIVDGHGSILEPRAISVEQATAGFLHEYRRKVRIINWMLRSALILLGEALARGRWLLAFQLLSHKINRWAIPIWLTGLFVANLLLLGRDPFYQAILVVQGIFYAMALTFLLWHRLVTPLKGRLGLPAYFLVVNAASLMGILTCLTGREVTWHKTR